MEFASWLKTEFGHGHAMAVEQTRTTSGSRGVTGFFAGGFLGARIEGARWDCDDPGVRTLPDRCSDRGIRHVSSTKAPVPTSAPAHSQSKLNQAVRSSLRPTLRYTTNAAIAVVAKYAAVWIPTAITP